MEYFSCREMMQGLLCLRHRVLQVEVDEDKRLKMDVQMLVRRKNVVVGELDLAVVIVAAAFGVIVDDVVRHVCNSRLMAVMMSHAMHTSCFGIDKTAGQVVVLSAVMELHVPTHRDEQHGKSHQKGSD